MSVFGAAYRRLQAHCSVSGEGHCFKTFHLRIGIGQPLSSAKRDKKLLCHFQFINAADILFTFRAFVVFSFTRMFPFWGRLWIFCIYVTQYGEKMTVPFIRHSFVCANNPFAYTHPVVSWKKGKLTKWSRWEHLNAWTWWENIFFFSWKMFYDLPETEPFPLQRTLNRLKFIKHVWGRSPAPVRMCRL